jgi:hypothetical protein
MKKTRSSDRLQSKQTRCIESLANEVLDLIISAARCEGTQDLLSLCLVSRQFYILTTPHIYRKIRLDLDRASHHRLLQRLNQPESDIPKMIRSLYISDLKGKHIEQLPQINNLVDALVNLEKLKWYGPLEMPIYILHALYTRFPKAHLSVMSIQSTFNNTKERHPTLGVLVHPAAQMLTQFNVFLGEGEQLYVGFKIDIMCTLMQSPALTHLRIIADTMGPDFWPTTTRLFERYTLPKLKELRLFVKDSSFFTDSEIELWGLQGGWDNLVFLGLYHMHSFLRFLGRMPNLDELWLIPRETHDIDYLGAHLSHSNINNAFGPLRRLTVRLPKDDPMVPHHTRRVVPWCILIRLPKDQLKSLNIHHPHQPGLGLIDVPLAQEVHAIRIICPNLEEFGMDIALQRDRKSWPYDIFRELAAFENITLIICVHLEYTSTALYSRLLLSTFLRAYYRWGDYFRKERKQLQIPWQVPFQACFLFAVLTPPGITELIEPTNPDFGFQIQEGLFGTRCQYTGPLWQYADEDLDRMSLEELKKKGKKKLLGKFGVNRRGYKREIRRREQHGAYDANITLYDLWK